MLHKQGLKREAIKLAIAARLGPQYILHWEYLIQNCCSKLNAAEAINCCPHLFDHALGCA